MERGFHNDFLVKALKSSCTFWWPVTETCLQDVYEDVLLTVFNLCADVLKIRLWHCWGRLEYQFRKGRQAWASRRLENWVLMALKIRRQNDGSSVNVFKSAYTSGRPVFETGLEDGYRDVLQTILSLTVLKRASSLGFKTFRKLSLEGFENTSSERRVVG